MTTTMQKKQTKQKCVFLYTVKFCRKEFIPAALYQIYTSNLTPHHGVDSHYYNNEFVPVVPHQRQK